MDLLGIIPTVGILALVIATVGMLGLIAGVALIVAARSRSRDVLDRASRERISERLDTLTGPAYADDLATGAGDLPVAISHAPRRRLWLDTSALLIVIGAVMLGVLATVGGTRPSGGVLGVTASARPTAPIAAVQDNTVAVPSASGLASSFVASPATPDPSPTARPPTPGPSGDRRQASPDRLAVLTPCATRTDCYVYLVRRGDNLISISNWFGVPYDAVLSLNPHIRERPLRPGDAVRLPTPRR